MQKVIMALFMFMSITGIYLANKRKITLKNTSIVTEIGKCYEVHR